MPSAGDRAVLKVSAVKPGYFDVKEVKTLGSEVAMPEKARVRPNDLLVTRANTAALVGAVCIAKEPPEGYFLCDKTLRLVPTDELLSTYAVHALATDRVRRTISEVATGTSASMKNISQEKIRALEVCVPSVDEQRTIAETLDVAAAAIDEAVRQSQATEELRRAVLHALVSGEYRLPRTDEHSETLAA